MYYCTIDGEPPGRSSSHELINLSSSQPRFVSRQPLSLFHVALLAVQIKAIARAGGSNASRGAPQPLNPPRTVPKPYAAVHAKGRGGSSL